jgi:hypothetical protein
MGEHPGGQALKAGSPRAALKKFKPQDRPSVHRAYYSFHLFANFPGAPG